MMMNMSVLAALAGLVFIGRATASGPFDGVGWELDAISAVFIGGAAVSGGGGDRRRLGDRRSGDGGVEQRAPAHGGGHRHHPDHQGAGAAGGGGLRPLQQAAGGGLPCWASCSAPQGPTPRPGVEPGDREEEPSLRDPEGLPPLCGDTWERLAVGAAVAVLAAALYLPGSGWSPRSGPEEAPVRAGGPRRRGRFCPPRPDRGLPASEDLGELGPGGASLFQEGAPGGGVSGGTCSSPTEGVAEQQNQISAMVARGAKVLVVGAIDGSQLGGQLREAQGAGVRVIAYDRLLTNTPCGGHLRGLRQLQGGGPPGRVPAGGAAEAQGTRPPGRWSSSPVPPDDANSQVFYQGALSVLQPRIADGTLVVRSGQVSFAKAATPGLEGGERPEAHGYAPRGGLRPGAPPRGPGPQRTPWPGRC